MKKEILRRVERLLEYRFSNLSLLSKALTHSSYADNRLLSNERLEFLGDSILALVVCKALFSHFPDYLEGDLTKIKSTLVSRKTCAEISNQLGLAKFVKVGRGMATTKAMSGSIAAGALESIIAAIYLDGGFEAATDFILRIFGSMIEKADAQEHQNNFKSILQQHAQQELSTTPTYELLDEKGPDHNKCFECAVIVGDRRFKSAWGVTKKEAEQKAAYNALIELRLLDEENKTG